MIRLRAGLLALGLVACAKPSPAPLPASAGAAGGGPGAPSGRAAAAGGETWAYDVVVAGPDLEVTATLPAGTGTSLSLEDGAAPFVSDLTAAGGANRAAAPARDGVWSVPECGQRSGCTLRYRFHLAEAARALGDLDTAVAFEGCYEAPPSTWLLRPTEHSETATYRFHVRVPPGSSFATGVHPIAGAADTYGASADDLDSAPYTVFGRFRARTLTRRGPTGSPATIELAILPGPLALDDAALDHWIDISADAIEAYYGRFPVPHVLIVLAPSAGRDGGSAGGRTLAGGGSSIVVSVGSGMGVRDVARDWVLTHEMTHLALPTLRREHHWLEEGLATYIEPIARAKVHTIPAREVWEGLVGGLPNGEPAAGDEGLDRTHTWGRTYWGGALFSFVADLEIRKRTGNAKSLEDALRGILAAGGNGEARWPLANVLRAGDRAVGVPVLEELHAKWGSAPVNVDLAKLWRELGVYGTGSAVYLEDDAPLAEVRRGVTAGKP